MNKKILYSAFTFLAISALQWHFLGNTQFNMDLFGDIITFLSIVFGFYITSLAIFVTSRYVSSLYNIIDEKNQSITLLHTLTNNYKFGLILTLVSLIYFIMIQFFIKGNEFNELSLGNPEVFPVFGILFLNFVFFFVMLRDLVNIIIQEGKQNS